MLVQMCTNRKYCRPCLLYTDTCPHNTKFFKAIFGANLSMKLGLFHLLHRIYETLDNKCDLFFKGLVSLKSAVYAYHEQDYASLLECLKDGTFSNTGKKYSAAEIEQMWLSKRWKQRYNPFLRKCILPGAIIQQNLSRWIVEFKNAKDDTGRSLFTQNTEKVANEQLKKVQHASDPPGKEMYQEIPPGKRSTHNLSKWASRRPESRLGKFHELLAHYSNTGMNAELADALTLGITILIG